MKLCVTSVRSTSRLQSVWHHVIDVAAWFFFLAGVLSFPSVIRAQAVNIEGRITDPQTHPVGNATVRLLTDEGRLVQQITSGNDGMFVFSGIPAGKFRLELRVASFEDVSQPLIVRAGESLTSDIQLKIAATNEEVRVSSDVLEPDVARPDPAQRLIIREETLDANPGRPGAPVSIPGLPIETASGGIKAPQYFAPGVAGDHGEPIASYIQVGSYLVSNNLSSNAHGNGYADPNILIPEVIGSVLVDGGAFNVREGNHSQNLSATYVLRSQFDSFIALTGDDTQASAATTGAI